MNLLESKNLNHSTIIAPRDIWDIFFSYRFHHPEVDFKLMELKELERLFSYQYDERAILYLLEKKMPYHLAVDTLDSLTHLKEGPYSSAKLNQLNEIKNELLSLNYLFADAYPEKEFVSRKVYVAGYANLNRIHKLLGNIPFETISLYETAKERASIDKVGDYFEEFHRLFNLLAEDIASGTPIDSIYLLGLKDEYANLISLFSKAYGIPTDFSPARKLIEEPIAISFLEEFKKGTEISVILNSLKNQYPESIYLQEMELLVLRFRMENYTLLEQYKLYCDLFFASNLKAKKKQNCVHILSSYFPPVDSHVYIMDFNLGNLPPSISDTSYLNDKEKAELGLETSKDVFIRNSDNLKALLSLSNVKAVLSLQVGLDGKPRYASPLASDSQIHTRQADPLTFEYSKTFAKLWLVSIQDSYRKYRESSPYFNTLKENLPVFKNYDSQYQGYSRFNESSPLKLSYSAMDEYFKCPFKYLCSRVAKIDDSETAFSAGIGTICHAVLEKHYQDGKLNPSFNFEKEWDKAVSEVRQGKDTIPLGAKEEVLFIRIKDILKQVISFIEEHEALSEHPVYFNEYQADISVDPLTKLVGKIDKAILTGSQERYLSIIDYKTSESAKYEEKLLKYGQSLQLPLYAYIAKKDETFKGSEPIGLYISPILPKVVADFEKHIMLNGIYSEEIEKIKTFEPQFCSSSYVKTMCLDTKGNFKNSRHKPASYFQEIATLAEEKIKEAASKIRANQFEVSPLITTQKSPCTSCPFGDVCYVRKESYRSVKREDFAAEEDEENA